MTSRPTPKRSVVRCHLCRRLAAFRTGDWVRPAHPVHNVVARDELGEVRILCLRCRVQVEEKR